MEQTSHTPRMSGGSLILVAATLALAPVALEVIGDGGPSKLGNPETGYAMVLFGIVMWPMALIYLLIGIKRILFGNGSAGKNLTQTQEPQTQQTNPTQNVTVTDAWANQGSPTINGDNEQEQEKDNETIHRG